jgi:hypothetical protein
MNNNYIASVEPLIFDTYEEFKDWLGEEESKSPSFIAPAMIGFPSKKESDKFILNYKPELTYDCGSVKYNKIWGNQFL